MYALVIMAGSMVPAQPPPPLPAPAPHAGVIVQQSATITPRAGCTGGTVYAMPPPVVRTSCSGGMAYSAPPTRTRHVVTTIHEESYQVSFFGKFRDRRAEGKGIFPLFRGRSCGG